MASPNINMRDPIIYRVAHMTHHNTGDKWCIYPMYDFAHPIEDAIEGVTHSICTLEFEDHRPLYDWVVRELEYPNPPRQIEFAKLYVTNVVTGKRYIKQLVDYAMLEYCIREDLKAKKPRLMAVLDPIKVIIDNYPEDQVEWFDVVNNVECPELGTRKVPFCKEIYIDRDDFMEEPPKKYFRLFPGNEVRLMGAYFVKCNEVIKDENGNVTEIHCTYDPETKSGSGFTGRKVKGTIHWVDANNCVPAEFRLYEPLILDDAPENEGKHFLEQINPNSLEILQGFIEPTAVENAKPQDKFQLVRNGFFNIDTKYTTNDKLVFNRIVPLKSSFKLK